MKKLLFIFCIILFISSCSDPFIENELKKYAAGTGSFILNINGNAGRTIIPNTVQSDFSSYTLEFITVGITSNANFSLTRTNENLYSPVMLNVGTWKLKITAYLQDGENLLPVAQGLLDNIQIGDGAAVTGNVILKPIIDSGEGTFSWYINYPDNVVSAKMTITSLNDSNEIAGRSLFLKGGQSLKDNEDSLYLNSGFYRVVFHLTDDQENIAIRSEILHIYQNLISDFSFTFTENHFLKDTLTAILSAWDGTGWNLIDSGITAAHFAIAGIQGVFDDNFDEIADWFDNKINLSAVTVDDLKVLVDLALVSVAANDPSFKQSSNYTNQQVAEASILSLAKNSMQIEIVEWQNYVIAIVKIAGQYNVSFAFDGEILPPLVGIEIASPPNKTYYLMGEAIDLTGLQVLNVYSDGLKRVLSDYSVNVNSFMNDTFRSGNFSVFISSNDNNNLTTSYNFTVSNDLIDTGLPVMYIETQNTAPILDKVNWINGSFIIKKDKNILYEKLSMRIRGRGNATWTYEKKPYRIRLDNAADLFGMGSDIDWDLLANYTDKTLLRAGIGFRLSEIMKFPWTPKSQFVEVVLNGEYIGNYQLVERVKRSDSRVNISSTGYLFERDNNYATSEDIWFSTDSDSYSFRYPDFNANDGNSSEFLYIKNYVTELETVLSTDNFNDPNTGYYKYLDHDSFARGFLLHNIITNKDTNLYLTKCDNTENTKISIGPVWDFEWSLGVGWYYGIRPAPNGWVYRNWWFSKLLQDPIFNNTLIEIWNTNKTAIYLKLMDYILSTKTEIYNSQKLNFRRWDILDKQVSVGGIPLGSFDAELQMDIQYFNNQIAWLDRAINNLSVTPADPLEGKLLIMQAYGSSNDAAGASNSFVELYNTTDHSINLDNISLYFANGHRRNDIDFSETQDQKWDRIPLSGIIPAKSSFLIVGPRQNINTSGNNAARYQIPINYGDINPPNFILSNRAFKVALIRGSNSIIAQNPFNIDGNGRKEAGYIDMIGSVNDSAAANFDKIVGFETAPAKNSASVAPRRSSLNDTNNNSVDFVSIDYRPWSESNPDRTTAEQLEIFRPKNSSFGSWDPFSEPPSVPVEKDFYEGLPPTQIGVQSSYAKSLFILQAGGASGGAISHTFVELYNAGISAINLSGLTLQYADGTKVPANRTQDEMWKKINLTGVIEPGHSFLILGDKGTTTSPQLSIGDGNGDMNVSGFVLNNRAFKVAIIQGTELLTIQNPFNMNGSGGKAAGYVDMVGVVNDETDKIFGYEGTLYYIPNKYRISQQASIRRISVIDTDVNTDDFETVSYRDITAGEIETKRPRNHSYGVWQPCLVINNPSEPEETKALMILQAGAATNGAITRSFVEIYNNTNSTITLTGNYSLHYGQIGSWTKINLIGTIPANCSFLLTGPLGTIHADNRLFINTADQTDDIFLLSNNGFKVVLMSNQNNLTVNNPFDIGEGIKAQGYIDLLGATNGTNPDAFETTISSTISKQAAARRKNLTDTDNNSIDFERIDYRTSGTTDEQVEKYRPRTTEDGAWNPFP